MIHHLVLLLESKTFFILSFSYIFTRKKHYYKIVDSDCSKLLV